MIFFVAKTILKLLAKLSSKNKYEFAFDMSDEDAVRNIEYLAHSLRKTVKTGVGVPVFPIKLAIKQCQNVLMKKKKAGRKLYDFEAWLFDNYRLLSGSLQDIDFKAFTLIPHVDGVPRIVVLADFIVKYSAGKVSQERVRRVVEAFNAVTPLTYGEIVLLKDAIAYRLLVEISYFAERSLHYYASYLKAKKSVFSITNRKSDSYLTYFAELHRNERVMGVDQAEFQTAALGFDNLLADNALLTSSYVNSLRSLGAKLTDGFMVSLSVAGAVYQKESSYRDMSDKAKNDYLLKTSECAVKNDVSEQVLAGACLSLADVLDVHFGEILFYYPKALAKFVKTGIAEPLRNEKSKVQGFYAFLVLAISLLIAAFPAYYLRNVFAYVAVLPLFIAVLHPVEYLLKRFYAMRLKSKPLLQMDYRRLPQSCATVVVTSRFIGGEKDADDALFQAETLAASESDPAVRFVVLADLPASDTEWGENDQALLDYLQRVPRSPRVAVFLRKRTRNGNKWRGYERKRGAILDAFSAMRDENYEKFYVIGTAPTAEYAILLDDDSELMPGTIRSAILAMAHPLNAEYDLMSFGGRVNRFSVKTHYGLRFLRGCGAEAYPFYSDFYADAFDCALYCGKAIVRIRPYLEKLKDFFQDGRILSHDIIEGAVLRSTSLKRCVYEDAPATFAGDYRRTARWQRGDVQLLPYAFCNKVKTKSGKRVNNPISPIYKLIIFINGMTVLRDFMTLFVVLLAFFSGNLFLLYYALSCHLFAKVYTLVTALRTVFTNVRFSHAVRGVVLQTELLAEELFLLPFRALCGLYLFFVTSFKMVVRSDSLLDWTPFRNTQQAGGTEEGARLLLPTGIALTALAILSGSMAITIYVVLFFFFAFYLLLSGKSVKTKSLSEKQTHKLKAYAAKIYSYFSEIDGVGLITDNLQLFPYPIKAKMTSPTNLGFALLAEICAYKLGLIDKETAFFNISAELDKVDKLEKYAGHLYNWYDVKTFEVMRPKVVSTVDSANYLCCLAVVEAFAKEEGKSELQNRAHAAIEQADFPVLYDASQKSLAIVLNTEENRLDGRYDLLASESRLAYYLAISKGLDPECYFRLGRDCTSLEGNTLLSWSGTAFEYMLPRIFLLSPLGSLIYEQELRSGHVQRKDKTQGVFGRSECGYYAFNDATAFLYKAVGCRDLALSGLTSDVIAPYATFLYLPCFPEACLDNLEALSKLGAEGEFGFYEAVDFCHQGDLVKSYMTHHQGMSLAAITNCVCNDEIARLFCSLPCINAVRILLTEENVNERKPRFIPALCDKRPPAIEHISFAKNVPDTLVVRCGEYRATYDALGRSSASLGEFGLTKNLDYSFEYGGLFLQIKENGKITSPCFYPLANKDCYAVFRSDSVKYVDPQNNVTVEVTPLNGYQGEIRKITFENPSEQARELTLSAYCDMMLNRKDAYDSHPAFSDMFVRAEYEDCTESQYLIRTDLNCKTAVAASLCVKGLCDSKVNCNSYNVIGRKGSAQSDFDQGVNTISAPSLGDVLYPCFGVSGRVTVPPHGKQTVYLCLLADKDLSALKDRNKKIDLAYRSGAIELLGRSDAEQTEDLPFLLKITGELIYGRTPQSVLRARLAGTNELAAYGVAYNEDLLFFDCAEEPDRQKLAAMMRVSKTLRENGVPCRTFVICDNLAGAGMDALDSAIKFVSGYDDKAIVLERGQGGMFRAMAKVILSAPLEEKGEISYPSYVLPEEDAGRDVLLPCGEGGFTKAGYKVTPFEKQTMLPYANVVGGKEGGFVLTESGGGFTFGKNAREDKLTVWTGDAVRDISTERVVLSVNGKDYLLNQNHCEHLTGASVFTHKILGATVRLSVSLFNNGKSKLYEIFLTEQIKNARLALCLIPALGWRFDEKTFVKKVDRGYELIGASGKSAYVYSLDGEVDAVVPQTKAGTVDFALNTQPSKRQYRFVLSSVAPFEISESELASSKAKCVSISSSNAVTVQTQDVFLNILNNAALPYQFTGARLLAKTGFYQCSGAYGFRDQLQDVLGMLLSDPEKVKEHILLAAAHQYEEGDVQHWWHPPKTGVRTRISDDRLWLVYVTERYLEVTDDLLILDQPIPFLSSPILAESELSRYEVPRDGETASLREHLLRAIRISLQHGEHGLLKMGTGDWNDGLDRVGAKGRGESVWLTMFAYKVIKDSLIFFGENVRAELNHDAEKLSKALLPLIKDGRYPLAFADDGKWLGTADGQACRLALNTQTWAVLSGAVPKDDAKRALCKAKALVDKDLGIVKLSAPPFDKHADYGYVAAYPKGVRENGGQYTHAAVWYLKALLESGEADQAYRVLTNLNPMYRCQTEEGAKQYLAEPYVLAADIYASEQYQGRAGWTWYTGSAAWLKYVLTEDFFGIKKRGSRLYVAPTFPSFFTEVSASVRLGDRTINIHYQKGEKKGLFAEKERLEYYDLLKEEKEVTLLCVF